MPSFQPCVSVPLRLVVLTALLLIASGCGQPEQLQAGPRPPSAAASASAAAFAAAPDRPAQQPTATTTVAPPMEQLLNLTAVRSYRLRLNYVDEQGAPMDIVNLDASLSRAGEVRMSVGSPFDGNQYYTTDRLSYSYSAAANTCAATFYDWLHASADVTPLQGSMIENVGQIRRWRLVEQGVQEGGVTADYYAVEAATFPAMLNPFLMEDERTIGDAWVARDGGYLVRYSAQLTLQPEDLAALMPGNPPAPSTVAEPATITWEYRLSDIDAVSLKLPDACRGVEPEDPTLYPDNYSGGAEDPCPDGALCFDSPDTPEAVKAFYRYTYVPEGWAVTEQLTGSATVLTFAKDGQTLEIGVSPDQSPPYTADENGNPYHGSFVWLRYSAPGS